MDKTYLQDGNEFETIYFEDYSDWKKFPQRAKSKQVKEQWEEYWSNRSEIVGNFESAHDLVLEILKKVPNSRDSDKILFYEIFKYYGIKISLSDLETIPSFEGFTRARRKIQETDYIASEETQIAREELEKKMRSGLGEI